MTAAAAKAQAPPLSIVDAFVDPQLLGRSFGDDTREAWRATLSGAFAVPMDSERASLFDRLSGGRTAPCEPVSELWVVAGRRSDKTHSACGTAAYIATIGSEQSGILRRLAPGERGVVLLLAVDRQQAKVALSYIRGMMAASPVLAGMVSREAAEGVELTNGVAIEVAANNYRTVRGRTMLACVLDEVAFFRDSDSSIPDIETYRALKPALATTGGMLIGISSPYSKRGLLYDKWRKHFGQDGDVLVVQGGTQLFNPTIDPAIVSEAEADDPESAKAEWHGQFRSDISSFVARAVVEDAMRSSPIAIPCERKRRYSAFIDPAGGGQDEFSMAIGHQDDSRIVVDCLLARRGTPAEIVAEYAAVMREYGLRDATSDKYAGSWPQDEFARHGIRVESSAKPKSDLYVDTLAALNSGRVELPPDERLMAQFIGLERRTSRSGRDSIDHSPNGHDDRCNAVAGLVSGHSARRSTYTLANL